MRFDRIFIRKQRKINPFSKELVEHTGIKLSELGITDKMVQAKIIHNLTQETAAHIRRIQKATEPEMDGVFQLYIDNMKKHLSNGGVATIDAQDDLVLWFANEVVTAGMKNLNQ